MSATGMTTEKCLDDWRSEVRVFQAVVFFSIALTLINYCVVVACKSRFLQHPWRAVYSFGGFAVIKFILAILLFTSLNPTCPSGCECGNYSPSYLYPSIVLLIAFIWLHRTYSYYKLAKNPLPPVAIVGTMMQETTPINGMIAAATTKSTDVVI